MAWVLEQLDARNRWTIVARFDDGRKARMAKERAERDFDPPDYRVREIRSGVHRVATTDSELIHLLNVAVHGIEEAKKSLRLGEPRTEAGEQVRRALNALMMVQNRLMAEQKSGT